MRQRHLDTYPPLFYSGARFGFWEVLWMLPEEVLSCGVNRELRVYILQCVCGKVGARTEKCLSYGRAGRSCGCLNRHKPNSNRDPFAVPPIPAAWRNRKPLVLTTCLGRKAGLPMAAIKNGVR